MISVSDSSHTVQRDCNGINIKLSIHCSCIFAWIWPDAQVQLIFTQADDFYYCSPFHQTDGEIQECSAVMLDSFQADRQIPDKTEYM